MKKVVVIGAGLAGSECAHSLAEKGIKVILLEAKKKLKTPAQKMDTACELVCTNSLKSKDPASAHGLLKEEMKDLDSLVLKLAQEHAVPAGGALAVDRHTFSQAVHETLVRHKNIEYVDEVVTDPLKEMQKYEAEAVVIATGPLTSDSLANWMQESLSDEDLYFYDAIAPVLDADSLDISKMYFRDRYGPFGEGDYLNIPLSESEYEEFVQDLIDSEKVEAHNFEDFKFFEGCLPIDTMAERGVETLRFSCMKPVGLELEDGSRPHAVIQLRKENLLGSAYNIVGFQNRLKYPEQKRIFSKLPGLSEANFIHLGSVHRNTFLNSKAVLNHDLSSKKFPRVYFAGQIVGVEGYTESASMGLYVAQNIYDKFVVDRPFRKWPVETAMGALVHYVMSFDRPAPSSINFGLIPTIKLNKEQRRAKGRKKLKKELASARAREVWHNFWECAE